MKLKKIKEQEENLSKIQYKNNRGVTIVALVISIIVMLILAGTTINLTMRGDGIFSEAIEAREKQQISQYEEKIELARGSVALENLGEVTLDKLIEEIYEEKIVPEMAITKLDEEKAKMQTKEGYTFIITAKKAEYAGKGDAVATPPDLQEGDVVFKLDPDTWTNGSVKVSVEANIKYEFTLQYSLDAANWIDYTGAIEVEENRTIYACIRNAIGEQGNYASTTINIIDKIDPQDFTPNLTSTTNSITVDASNAKDGEATSKYGESGIKEIWYSDDAGTTWETNEEDKANTKYTFKELIQGKEYEVQVKVIDNAGNQIITKAQKITTTTITGLAITVKDADTWTNGTKTVTITAANSNYSTIRYTTDGSVPTTNSTEYIKEFTVSSNCTITAVAFDSTNQVGATASNTVTKIDTLDPTGSIEVSTTTNSATVTVTAQDQAATSTNGDSGIKGYYYSKDGGSTYTDITTATTYEFTNLEQSKEYSIRVKVVDNAENETVLSPTGTVGTATVAGLTITVEDADTWTNGTKRVTITAANSNYSTIRYTTDGTTPTTSSTAYTKAFTVSSNCTITAVAFDSTNQVGATASNTVTKIDKLAPATGTATGSVSVTTTTNSATVTVSATDQAKTSTNGMSGIKGYYYSKDGGSSYTAITTATSYTFTSLTQTKQYSFKVKVEDNAGNQTVLSSTGTTSTVAGLTVSVANADTWTNGTKTITITAANSNYSTIRYTLDGTTPTTSSTAYTKAFTVSSNCTITAVAFDSTNQVGATASNTVTKIDKLAPATGTATGSVSVTTTTNSAKVTVTATDQAKTTTNGMSGIKGYYYSKDGGSSYTAITTATSYTFQSLTQTKQYSFKVKVEDNAGNQTVLSNTGTTSTVAGLTVSVGDADTWSKTTKTITITAANSNYSTIRYTLDGTTPTTSSTAYTKAFTVSSNCTITAVAFDSTNQVGLAATNTVTKIDKLSPATGTATGSVSVTTTTNSATVTVSATDQAKTSTNGMSGIKGYYYSKDGGSTYTSITTATSYTFSSLTQTKQYSFKVKVEDNAGNQTVLSSTGTTGTVAGLTVSVGNADTWTNGTKTITITAANSNYKTIRYTLDGTTPTTSSTAYTKAFTVSSNCTITAVAVDSTNQVGVTASNTVTKIDKLAPATGTATGSVSVTTTTNSATVKVTATDQAKTSTNGMSGIKGYYYSKDGGSTYTSITTATSYTFSSLTQTKQYSFKVKVEDNAGNQTVLSGAGTTSTVAGLTVSVGNADTWTNGTKRVTITAANSNYSTIRYTTDGSMPTTSSTAYTKAFTVSSNCTITAVAFDSTNQVGATASNTVTKIDKLAPATGTATGSVSVTTTTNSATVTVSATDQAKTSTNGMSGIKGYYYSKDGGSSYTAITTATSYTFSSLTQTKQYSFKVKVEDNAGNQTVLSSTGTTGTVAGLTVSVANADTWKTTKTVTITAANSNYSTIRYTTNGTTPTTSSTAYSGAFTVSSNCTITAVAFDSTNQVGASATKTVTKIDTTVPQMVSITSSAVSWSGATGTVTITGKAKDVNSGLIAYQFSTNASLTASSSGWTTITATTAEISKTYNVTATGTYYFYVKDQAGNINKNSIAVTISDTTKPTISLTANTTATANSVTLTGTSQDKESGIVGYAFAGDTQPTSWTAVTQTTEQISKKCTIEFNDTVYFWTKDGKGNVNSASCKVTNIVSRVSMIRFFGNVVTVGDTAETILLYEGTPKSKTFSSSNTSVATINASGAVTGVATGTATMTVTLTNYDGTTETKTCTVTVNNPTLASKAKPGDYVEYDGGNEYEGLWQVLYNDDTYGLQIISAESVKDFTLGGSTEAEAKASYNNAVDTLNEECRKYVNTSYATSGRCVGSNPLSPDDAVTDTVTLPFTYKGTTDSGCKVADTNYETDYNAMKNATIHNIDKSYWLASRIVYSFSNYASFLVRFVDASGSTSSHGLWHVNSYGSSDPFSNSHGLRPVITLESDLQTSSGDGSEANAFKLVAK